VCVYMRVCVFVFVHVCVCVCACMHLCASQEKYQEI
jgi:hypothetical protein